MLARLNVLTRLQHRIHGRYGEDRHGPHRQIGSSDAHGVQPVLEGSLCLALGQGDHATNVVQYAQIERSLCDGRALELRRVALCHREIATDHAEEPRKPGQQRKTWLEALAVGQRLRALQGLSRPLVVPLVYQMAREAAQPHEPSERGGVWVFGKHAHDGDRPFTELDVEVAHGIGEQHAGRSQLEILVDVALQQRLGALERGGQHGIARLSVGNTHQQSAVGPHLTFRVGERRACLQQNDQPVEPWVDRSEGAPLEPMRLHDAGNCEHLRRPCLYHARTHRVRAASPRAHRRARRPAWSGRSSIEARACARQQRLGSRATHSCSVFHRPCASRRGAHANMSRAALLQSALVQYNSTADSTSPAASTSLAALALSAASAVPDRRLCACVREEISKQGVVVIRRRLAAAAMDKQVATIQVLQDGLRVAVTGEGFGQLHVHAWQPCCCKQEVARCVAELGQDLRGEIVEHPLGCVRAKRRGQCAVSVRLLKQQRQPGCPAVGAAVDLPDQGLVGVSSATGDRCRLVQPQPKLFPSDEDQVLVRDEPSVTLRRFATRDDGNADLPRGLENCVDDCPVKVIRAVGLLVVVQD